MIQCHWLDWVISCMLNEGGDASRCSGGYYLNSSSFQIVLANLADEKITARWCPDAKHLSIEVNKDLASSFIIYLSMRRAHHNNMQPRTCSPPDKHAHDEMINCSTANPSRCMSVWSSWHDMAAMIMLEWVLEGDGGRRGGRGDEAGGGRREEGGGRREMFCMWSMEPAFFPVSSFCYKFIIQICYYKVVK